MCMTFIAAKRSYATYTMHWKNNPTPIELQNISSIKNKLDFHHPTVFSNADNSFTHFISRLYIKKFRHIKELEILFEHPVTVISGTNKIGKTSILLLLACSHYDFLRVDSTKPTNTLRRHTWKDVLQFTLE